MEKKEKKDDETFLLSRALDRHSSVDNLHTHCGRCAFVGGGKAGRLIYFGYARCPVLVCVGTMSSRFDSVFPLHSVSLEFTFVLFAFN